MTVKIKSVMAAALGSLREESCVRPSPPCQSTVIHMQRRWFCLKVTDACVGVCVSVCVHAGSLYMHSVCVCGVHVHVCISNSKQGTSVTHRGGGDVSLSCP